MGTLGKLKQKTDKSRVDQGSMWVGAGGGSNHGKRQRVWVCERLHACHWHLGDGRGAWRRGPEAMVALPPRRLDIFRCEATPAPATAGPPRVPSASVSSGTRRRGTRPLALCIVS